MEAIGHNDSGCQSPCGGDDVVAAEGSAVRCEGPGKGAGLGRGDRSALGMGIGLPTLMFSVIYGVLLRGLDVDEADHLLIIVRSDPSRGYPELWVQQHDFHDWRAQQRSFEGLAGRGRVYD